MSGRLPTHEAETPIDARACALSRPNQPLANKLLMPRNWLVQVVELLEEKQQIVLYGPPGTGKTYLAQEFADHITAARQY